MRLALLFHGYLRQYEMCFKNIKDKLKLNKFDYDIFIYTSKNNHLKIINKNFPKSKPSILIQKIDNVSETQLQNIYGDHLKKIKYAEDDNEYKNINKIKFNKLKKYYQKFMTENPNLFTKNNFKNGPFLKHNFNRIKRYLKLDINKSLHTFRAKPWIFRQNDQFLRMYLCSKLLHAYSKKYNITYDIVIQIRPDTLLIDNIDLNMYLDKIKSGLLLCKLGLDFFYISNMKVNKKLNQLYDYFGTIQNIKDLKTCKTFFSPERQSKLFIISNLKIYNMDLLNPAYLQNIKNKKKQKKIYDEYNKLSLKYYNVPLIWMSQPLINNINN